MIKNPPTNIPGDPTGDRTTGTGAEAESTQPNTVEAKPVEESTHRSYSVLHTPDQSFQSERGSEIMPTNK